MRPSTITSVTNSVNNVKWQSVASKHKLEEMLGPNPPFQRISAFDKAQALFSFYSGFINTIASFIAGLQAVHGERCLFSSILEKGSNFSIFSILKSLW